MTIFPQTGPRRLFRRPSLPILIAAALVLVLLGTLLARILLGQSDPLNGGTAVATSRGALVDGITATGNVAPRVESHLTFASRSGRVAEVFVDEGDRVGKGQALVALETAQLDAAVTAAEARLAQARADLSALQEGATPAEIAQAEAQVAEAQAGLSQAQGQVTPEQLGAARADLTAAKAALAQIEAGPKTTEVQAAQATLAATRANLGSSEATLQSTRDARSSAKTAAEQDLQAATLTLQQAQSDYSEAYWAYRGVEQNGRVPARDAGDNNGELTDYGNLTQQEAFKRAELKLKAAELGVQQAAQALAQARRDEATAVQAAEQQRARAEADVSKAQADLDQLLAGADADARAQARARVAQAESALAQLQGGERAGSLAAGAARIAEAQAGLNKLREAAKPSALAKATAQVAQAEAELKQAQVDRSNAILRAPFAGAIAKVSVAAGETVDQVAPVTLVDDSSYQIDLTVDEVDVARVAVGQPVEVLVDALGAPALTGRVRQIAPSAVTGQEVRTYAVSVDVTPGARPLRSGMTASATIVAQRRDQVLSVPTGAVREENGRSFVEIISQDARGNIALSRQEVTTGLRVGDRVEITSGISERQQVLLPARADA